MEFSKLSSPSLKDLFVKEIERMIISGSVEAGDHLPPERELAEQMGISRSVVNAGIVELCRKGFVEVQPRVGAFIADYKRRGTVETLLAILQYNGGALQKNEIKSLLEIRLVVETLSIELAIPRMTDEDIMGFRNLAEQFHQAADPAASAEKIFLFHHELCILSGNTLAPVIFYSFKVLSTMLWERYFKIYGNEALYESTCALCSCFEQRNAAEAVRVFQASVKDTIEGMAPIY